MRFKGMISKSNVLALVFGALLILVTFGDHFLAPYVGNLDTIFGRAYIHFLDMIVYPFGSIAVFLLYGKVKGGLKINVRTVGIFLSFLAAFALMIIEDIGTVLHLSITPPTIYWVVISWFYPFYSAFAFFIFGKENQAEKVEVGKWVRGVSLRKEILALVFGALLIFVTFGDSHLTWDIGNLNSIFGSAVVPLLAILYPLASIAVFLLYGWVKGGLRISVLTMAVFLSYLVAIVLINLDDIASVLHLSITLPTIYWAAVEWFYPFYSAFAFLVFGKANRVKKITG